MEIGEFAQWVAETARVAEEPADRERLAYLGLGLTSEAGEVADHIKRLLRDGDGSWRPEDMAEQPGDLAYYWAALCVAAGADPTVILDTSRRKITARIASASARP